jgi:hypothetical protein
LFLGKTFLKIIAKFSIFMLSIKTVFHGQVATLTQVVRSLAGTIFVSDSHWLATLFLLGLVGRGGRVGAKNSSGSNWNRVSSPPLAPNCAPATAATGGKGIKGVEKTSKMVWCRFYF